MSIKVLVFGSLTEITKTHELNISGVSSTQELTKQLAVQFPKLAEANYSLAVNKKTVPAGAPLHDGDEVALLPPFSGG